MQSVQLVDIWQILAKNIGRQFSGFLDTCVALLMLAYSLGELEMKSLGMLILILLETLIKRYLLQGMSLLLVVELSVRRLPYRIQLHCLLQRLSTWLLLRLVRKLFG